VLACSGLVLAFLQAMFNVKKVDTKRVRIPLRLSDPPVDLVKSMVNEQCVLWAGAGLAAQSGYPARKSFAVMMMQAATVEGWVPAQLAQKLQRMCANEKHEEALNELARTATDRSKLIEFTRSTYARFAVPSRSHELIGKLPLRSAMTTNYDQLLEQVGDAWDENTITLSDHPSDDNFLLKLYGTLRTPRKLSLSCEEFSKAVPGSVMALCVAQAFETQTLLFVGCSPEGLLADLKLFNIGRTPTRTHYALAGVSGSAWRGQAHQLSKRYGIELLVCDAEQISKALPVFLEKLAEEVGRLNQLARVASE
jgi:hypothetical protein